MTAYEARTPYSSGTCCEGLGKTCAGCSGLRAQIVGGLPHVGGVAEQAHFEIAFIAPPDSASFFFAGWSGLASAMARPSGSPSMITWLSLRRTSLTSWGRNPSGL